MPRAEKTPQQRLRDMHTWIESLNFAAIASPDGNAKTLRRIGDAQLRSLESDERLFDAVRVARTEGHTWGQIAAVLGVSRQAATQRFGAVENGDG
jgi:hypothetical protein